MTCVQGIPTESKARRIVQCPGDEPIRVSVEGGQTGGTTSDFDHTIMCMIEDSSGILSQDKVVVVTHYDENGIPTSNFYSLSTGQLLDPGIYSALTTCDVPHNIDFEQTLMCDPETRQTFQRWIAFRAEGAGSVGFQEGSPIDMDSSGQPYTSIGTPTFGACEAFRNPDIIKFNGTTDTTGSIPVNVLSLTITVLAGSVQVTSSGVGIPVILPTGSSFTWGCGNGEINSSSNSFSIVGTDASAEYIIHWER